jgi:glycosyltransferase involved in cell wall biosynthesis
VKPGHLCHIFPAFATGGPQVRTAVVINGLDGEFRHTIVALNGDLSCRSRLNEPEKVACRQAPPHRRHGVIYLLGLARLLGSIKPDAIITYNWGGTDGLLAARLAGIRRVIHAEDGFGPEEARGQKLRRVLARRLLLRAATQVVCPSQTLVRIARHTWSIPLPKVCYLPNGVDTSRFAPPRTEEIEAARRRLGIAPGEIVVGSVGQLRGEKNHARLLRAFAAVAAGRPCRLLLVGDGPLLAPLIALARELSVEQRVLFAGNVMEPAEHYRAMDLFALSSDTEQMPIAVLEAMATGLPVISTDVGDVRAMLSEENRAFIVPPRREDTYAARLAALIDDSASRRVVGQANRTRCVLEYGIDRMVRAYQRLYRAVLYQKRGQTPEDEGVRPLFGYKEASP